jgi:hypothetical protein
MRKKVPFLSSEEGEDQASSLSAFLYVNRDGEDTELTPTMEEWLAKDITKTFDRLDDARASKKTQWERVEKAVRGVISKIDTDRFYGLVPFGKQSVQTILAHFWGRTLQTPKVFFSVDGMDEKSKDLAPVHKEHLMLHCKKDRVPQKLDKGLNLHGLIKGLMVFHVGVCNKKRQLHGRRDILEMMDGVENVNAVPGTEDDDFVDAEQKLYEGATLTIIDPYDFVFDTENHEEWDSCFKACRKWMVYEDLEADPNFSNYEELYELVEECTGTKAKGEDFGFGKLKSSKKKKRIETGINDQGRIEIIEFHGDIRLKDGSYLRNWTVVVAGRKKIIRFEQNPFYINPFVKWEYEEAEDGMGISPISYIMPLIDASSLLLSTGVEGAKQSIAPTWLAEESMFPNQKKIYASSGSIIKYKANNALPNVQPQPIQFNYQAPFSFIQLFEGQSEATTGATRQMSGNVTTNDKAQTATEFQGLQVVGNLIIDRLVDKFNLDAKIPILEKMALINAMFAPIHQTIKIDNDKGLSEYKEVGAEVYAGNYNYIIEDSKSEIERKQNQREKLDMFMMTRQDPIIGPRMKAIELAKEIWRDFGYGKPGQYFFDDAEFVQEQAKEMRIQAFIQSLGMQAANGFMDMGGMMNGPASPVDAQAVGQVEQLDPMGGAIQGI